MAARAKKQNAQGASLSFLDVIACAFGAVILLVLTVPIGDSGSADTSAAPVPEKASRLGQLLYDVDDIENEISVIEAQIRENQGIVDQLRQSVRITEQSSELLLSTIQDTVTEATRIDGLVEATTTAASILENTAGEEEEKQFVATEYAGIPVDAEYVAFVVDTSGSMNSIKSHVRAVMDDLLDIYPNLRGIQILNDQGVYIEQAGRWIEDSPSARARLSGAFRRWAPWSRSNPARGIRTAIEQLYTQDIRMALFVLGDDYPSTDFQNYLDSIAAIVRANQVKAGSFRLHAVAFPHGELMGAKPGGNSILSILRMGLASGVSSPLNYLILMRELTRQHDGTLVALELRR